MWRFGISRYLHFCKRIEWFGKKSFLYLHICISLKELKDGILTEGILHHWGILRLKGFCIPKGFWANGSWDRAECVRSRRWKVLKVKGPEGEKPWRWKVRKVKVSEGVMSKMNVRRWKVRRWNVCEPAGHPENVFGSEFWRIEQILSWYSFLSLKMS